MASFAAFTLRHQTPAVELLALLESVRPLWVRDSACREHPELPWVRPPRRNVDGAAALVAMRGVCHECLVRPECRAMSTSAAAGTIIGVYAGRIFAPNANGTAVAVTDLDGLDLTRTSACAECGDNPVARGRLCWACYNRRRRDRSRDIAP